MRILIIDDDPQIPETLSVGFQLHWKDVQVIAAADGESGLRLFVERLPDVVLLDLGLPQRNGFQVLQEIRRVSDVPVIILTARGQEADQVRGLESGADDYVVKPFGYMALIARIDAVLRRARTAPSHGGAGPFMLGDLRIDFEDGAVTLKGRPVRLTPLEYKLLVLLARNRGQLLTHDTLITRLWGESYGATRDHLKVFVSRLRAKIESDAGPRMIETERGMGYRLVDQPQSPSSNPPGAS